MAELVPYPFDRLVTRVFHDLAEGRDVLHLPKGKIVRGLPGRDLTVRFHDRTASTPLGPAAGPHSQLAQNIVLSFLGGGRVFEDTRKRARRGTVSATPTAGTARAAARSRSVWPSARFRTNARKEPIAQRWSSACATESAAAPTRTPRAARAGSASPARRRRRGTGSPIDGPA